jgi:hypothetical protein
MLIELSGGPSSFNVKLSHGSSDGHLTTNLDSEQGEVD